MEVHSLLWNILVYYQKLIDRNFGLIHYPLATLSLVTIIILIYKNHNHSPWYVYTLRHLVLQELLIEGEWKVAHIDTLVASSDSSLLLVWYDHCAMCSQYSLLFPLIDPPVFV